MSETVLEPRSDQPPRAGRASENGGASARRAVVRWSWRLFRREWRQQLLILALVTLSVAAAIIGSAVATNTPVSATSGFGTASDAASFSGSDPHVVAQIASLEHRFGSVDVIKNETVSIPGSINTYQLRAENPSGPFGKPMLSLVSGHFPSAPDQAAVTTGVASDFDLKIGSIWHQGGMTRRVVGIVENPQNLLDEFALVPPGQVRAPTQVTVLFDAPGVNPATIGPNVLTPASVAQANALNPETISLAVLTIAMLLIALVAVGGFTVLAQRRRRSLGMLESIGATDAYVALVVRANGLVTGVVGALLGTALGLVLWLAYRPELEQSVHHVIGLLALPWVVVAAAVVLALVATYAAASLPARALRKVSIVAALSGRPATPRQVHRSRTPWSWAARDRVRPSRVRREHRPRHWQCRNARTRPRARAAHPGGGPLRPELSVAPWPHRWTSPCRDPPRAARPCSLPSAVGLGARGDQSRRDDRGGHHRHRRCSLW